MDFTFLLDVLKESVVLTLTVIALMSAIEAFNFTSHGKMIEFLHGSKAGQIIFSALFGAIPGCVGGYFTVSLYSKKMFTFGALLAMAVATTGDEAFVMLAMYPKTAVIIFLALMVFGAACGFIYDRMGERYIDKDAADCDCVENEHGSDHKSLKHRLLHTLEHGLRIFLWTFCVMAIVEGAEQFVDLEAWVNNNTLLMIVLAALIGCIPQSGPHIAFVTLFASGVLPLPVLLASCVSQDGHAGLPLIAASRKDFFRLKAVKLILAIGVGVLAMLFGFFC